METAEAVQSVRKPSNTKNNNSSQELLKLVQEYCENLKYNGRMIIKHLYDNASHSAFRVNWYKEERNENAPAITTERITTSRFIVIDIETQEIKSRMS